ncbi:MAG: FAD-dependent monooxygenase [Pigmentiphaga sp.]
MGKANSEKKIVVAGAGMGGLATALGLARKGFQVAVYEQAPEHRELGAGLWVSVNGARVLDGLGLTAALEAINLPPDDRVVRLWSTGESWSIYNKDAANSSEHTLYMVLRYELHRILLEALEKEQPGCVYLDHKCTGFENADDHVLVHFDGKPSVRADALIGADGVHSRVRREMFGEVKQKFTGAIAWRGLVPIERIAASHRAPLATTWVGPAAHITTYPVQHKGRQYVSFSGQVDSEQWEQESWSDPGKLGDCLKDFEGWHEQVIEMVSGADILYKWGLFVREELPTWVQGRVTLVGDACHSMVPYLGQGVNMAFEDSSVLVNVLDGADDMPAALEKYDSLRRERCYKVARSAMDMLAVFHHEDLRDEKKAKAYIESAWGKEKVRERYDWIVSYNALEVGV